ncbi:hypothetical protein KEJ47_05110 [Candidatus Bathyarchaeota archaeon]|nr:hypothetical protein [Candidatus Bathyarchaeota archaeon]
MLQEVTIFLINFVATFLATPFVSRKLRELGFVGVDVHKKEKPTIPEMGGIAMLIGLIVSVSVAMILLREGTLLLTSFLFTVLVAGIVGLADDVFVLNARVKPVLLLFAGLPILIMRTYMPHPILPFVGAARLTIVYPLIIPVAISVCANAVNMMDPFNGVMAGSNIIATTALLISALLLNRGEGIILSLILLGSLIPFFYFNRYPSKIFSGDIGSLTVGAAYGAIAILGRLEVVAVVAFIPQIMNAFYGLSTLGRLYERREVSRPISILDDGRLTANSDPSAPITLARLILAKGPLSEKDAIKVFYALSFISSVFAIITALFTMVSI